MTGLEIKVAPRAGAWVETAGRLRGYRYTLVAPRAGAWVETHCCLTFHTRHDVAPRAGAWVETASTRCATIEDYRRTPCGCVG